MSDPLDSGEIQGAPSPVDAQNAKGMPRLSRRQLLVVTAVAGAAGTLCPRRPPASATKEMNTLQRLATMT